MRERTPNNESEKESFFSCHTSYGHVRRFLTTESKYRVRTYYLRHHLLKYTYSIIFLFFMFFSLSLFRKQRGYTYCTYILGNDVRCEYNFDKFFFRNDFFFFFLDKNKLCVHVYEHTNTNKPIWYALTSWLANAIIETTSSHRVGHRPILLLLLLLYVPT